MLVSIIVPVYNAEEYLAESVQSLINQTFKKIEILLIDDGSPDNSGILCDELAKMDGRIKVIHKENGGAASARNLGIEMANGEYIMFLDSDDWLEKQAIEILVNKIEEEPLDIVRFNYIREFGDGSRIKENTFLKLTTYDAKACKEVYRQSISLIGNELKHPENQNFLASACFNIYKRELIVNNNIRFESLKELGSFEDGLFNVHCYSHMKSFAYLDQGLYHYRKTNVASFTSNYRENFLRKNDLLVLKLREIIEAFNTEHIEVALNNRIAIGTFELCLNAMKSKHGFSVKYSEIKEIISDKLHKDAFKKFAISYLPLKWRIYYFLIKIRFTLGVYLMTYAIRKLMARGN